MGVIMTKKSKKSNKIIWISLIVIAILIIGTVIGTGIYYISNVSGKSDIVVAKVNGVEIFQNEVDRTYDSLPMQLKATLTKIEALNYTIVREVYAQEANKEGVSVTQEEKDELMNATGKTKEEIIEVLEKEGLDWDYFNNEIETSIKIEKYLKERVLDQEITEEEMQNFYNENKKLFVVQGEVQAKHILVDNEELAKEIIIKLNEGGDFSELAMEYSSCPSKHKGGDLGFFTRGKMVPEFEEAAFNLGIGEMTQKPVKTQFGYHIIVVEDRKEGSEKYFAEVKDQIEEHLQNTKKQEILSEMTKELMKAANIEIIVPQKKY